MNKFLNVMRAVVLSMALGFLLQAQALVADAKEFQIPGPKADGIAGAAVPYVRYDSQKASLGGGATLKTSAMMDRFNIASQASEQSYVELPGNGASAEWTVHVIEDANVVGRGVTMRFTMPDTSDGMGQKGSLDVYVNGNKVKTVDLNSYWMWQYFASGNPSDAPDGGVGCFAFDEVHFLLDEPLKEGDRIKIQSSGANGLTYGVDFLEIEDVVNPIGRPSGAVSVTDFGACPDDGKDDLAAFVAAVKAADAGSKVVYIPKGTWHLSGMWNIYCKDVKITGAGIWYTNIQFTSDKAFGGGISGGNGSNGGADGYCKNLEFCNMYINSNLRSRYNQQAVYKCFMDVFCDGSVIHDVWEEHFETGFWFGDYNGAMDYSDGVKVINCRIRNNLADGVNFCQGTSNAAVYNCSIRNNGDDGLACWNNSYMNAKDEENNVFAYNTIEFIWRAGGIALYGGSGHHVYNNYIRDMFMAAGIHLNTTFDGYKFSNNKGITFENNILVRCGTNADSWNEDLAAVDLKQDVKNITFRNTQIYDSPFDAVRTLTGPSNVVFYDTQILGTGLTGEDITYSCVGHTCGAMRIADKNVKFNGLKIANYGSDKKGNNSTYPFWTDNNKDLAQSLGAELLGNNVSYVVPEPGRVILTVPVVDPWENVKGYDLELKELSWRNQNAEYNLQEGDQVVLYGKIKNNSDIDIPEKANFTVAVNIDGVSKGSVTISDGLKAHESVDFKLASSWKSVKGGHVAVATVCPDTDLKNELTEDNNSRTKRFNVSASADNSNKFTPVMGGYDLVVTKVFVSNKKDEDAINTGDHLVMGAVIANAGDKDVPAGTKIGLQFQMDGKTYGTGFITWCDTFKDGLKSHATATLIANGGGGSVTTGGADNYFIAPEGSHTITAWIDDTNDWKEVDENNNKKVMNLKTYGLNGFTDYSIKHCVNAGKIFAESNPYEDKDVDSRKYDNSVAVLVKADEGSTTGTGTLYIGAGKRANEGGYAYFDNFQLFYMGDKQWYLDATNTSTEEFTTTKKVGDTYYTPSGINRNSGAVPYTFPVIYNIRRYFNVGKWESLILPCTLTGDQVKQTFGGDQEVKLSAFDRVEGTCVYFKTVDTDKEGIVAGKPYIIKVGKEADIKTKNDEYTFPWGINTTVKVKGPIYQVKGVVPPTFTGDGVTTEETTSGGYKVQFHGFYYDPGAAPRNAYVINNGDMYHLSSDWNSFVGTSWYVTITDAQGNAKALSFSFDGDSSTTAIENVTRQEDAAVQADGFVYNLSGQRVGTRNNMSNLSSGIYIVGGKKVVVK